MNFSLSEQHSIEPDKPISLLSISDLDNLLDYVRVINSIHFEVTKSCIEDLVPGAEEFYSSVIRILNASKFTRMFLSTLDFESSQRKLDTLKYELITEISRLSYSLSELYKLLNYMEDLHLRAERNLKLYETDLVNYNKFGICNDIVTISSVSRLKCKSLLDILDSVLNKLKSLASIIDRLFCADKSSIESVIDELRAVAKFSKGIIDSESSLVTDLIDDLRYIAGKIKDLFSDDNE